MAVGQTLAVSRTTAAPAPPAGAREIATTAVRKPSANGTSAAEIRACLEILKRLAPAVTPELPTLVTLPPPPLSTSSSSTLKRKLGSSSNQAAQEEGKHKKLSNGSVAESSHSAEEAPSKRRKQDDGRGDSAASDEKPLSASSEARSIALKKGFSLKRSNGASAPPGLNGKDSQDKREETEEGEVDAEGESDDESLPTGSTAPGNAHTSTTAQQASPPAPVADPHPAGLNHARTASTSVEPAPESLAFGPTWSRDRFKRLASICRERGRALKHSGDRRMREYAPQTAVGSARLVPILALLEQVDAIILYSFAFWCEDQAAGSLRQPSSTGPVSTMPTPQSSSGLQSRWKPGCVVENWKSIFGLVAFAKSRSEKMLAQPPTSLRSQAELSREVIRGLELITAWLSMLEAIILQHITTNTSRYLGAQASRLLASAPAGGTPTSHAQNGPSPPGGDNESVGGQSSISSNASAASHPPPDDFLKSYMRLQSDLEKIHSLWPASQSTLLRPAASSGSSAPNGGEDVLSRVLRKGRVAYITEPTKIEDVVIPSLPADPNEAVGAASPEDLFKDEENYYSFAWPMVLHSQNTVTHATSFGRALIQELSERLGLDFQPERLQ